MPNYNPKPIPAEKRGHRLQTVGGGEGAAVTLSLRVPRDCATWYRLLGTESTVSDAVRTVLINHWRRAIDNTNNITH